MTVYKVALFVAIVAFSIYTGIVRRQTLLTSSTKTLTRVEINPTVLEIFRESSSVN
jgi:hypothetical protein